ncbi:histone H3.v1 [Takifugu flavidus]|uniref:histone H3.v1 n=1 Tax=Takifugu flavidus TaxID=433684 RepID=UPI002544634C|nr:histone H3.v1 [Takifugu flavidus]
MGDMDPEDTKSLDSGDSTAMTAEENHSSNSDMVHLEREEAELLEEAEKEEKERRAEEEEEEEEEDEELQTSVLSILGGERETFEEEQELQAPVPEELLESVEESCLEKKPAEFTQAAMLTTLPPLPIVKLDPPSTTSTPVQSITTAEAKELYCAEGLRPPSILVSAEPLEENDGQQFQQIPLSGEPPAEKKTSTPPKTSKPTLSSTELMCGGAALVAVVGVVAYGAVAYCRK